jgi:hypothetical protein
MQTIRAKSPSDPAPGLRFDTVGKALAHCVIMNKALETFDGSWNKDYWKNKPEPWVVILPREE